VVVGRVARRSSSASRCRWLVRSARRRRCCWALKRLGCRRRAALGGREVRALERPTSGQEEARAATLGGTRTFPRKRDRACRSFSDSLRARGKRRGSARGWWARVTSGGFGVRGCCGRVPTNFSVRLTRETRRSDVRGPNKLHEPFRDAHGDGAASPPPPRPRILATVRDGGRGWESLPPGGRALQRPDLLAKLRGRAAAAKPPERRQRRQRLAPASADRGGLADDDRRATCPTTALKGVVAALLSLRGPLIMQKLQPLTDLRRPEKCSQAA
jgi:hypothetical protein